MSKLSWKSLNSPSLSDPAVRGEGYQLRYRARKGGTFAELRWKAGPGAWKSYPLGRVPSEWEAGALSDPLLTGQAVNQLGKLDGDTLERVVEQLSPDKPVPVEAALDPIRDKARALVAQLRRGVDPRGAASADSLRGLVDQYIQHVVADQRPRTQAESKRHLLKHWKPLHARAAGQLTRRDVAEHLLTLKADSGPVAANRARASLSALFAWALRQGLAESNPVAGTGKAPEQSRDRVLSLAELRTIWHAAGDGDHGVIVRLLALTGQRREEVGGMRWSELDLDRALWSLPGSRTKNGRPHLVPLSSQAVELLRAVGGKPGRDNVFGNGAGSFSGWSRSKRRLDGRCGVPGWTLHDLRRSWATHVNELIGAAPHVVEAALNHLSGTKAGVAGVYNRASYLPERARAMQSWADHLLQSAPAKVVPLRA